MDGRLMGAGAGFFGFGGTAIVGATVYAAPALLPVAEVLMGIGGALFLRGLSTHIPHAQAILAATGLGLFTVSTYLLLSRLAIGAGFALSWFALAWLLTVLGEGLYSAASARAVVATR
jgi:hypothetical protein